ncbi:hypothetical protein Misp01_41080 [Microtetraspora sp. NBRC 13810]|uniref:hypothetical protein n=1 Tax=Microtetraspora sp. NBRC 13810 TaxID=3030990 RepID=UPI0025561CD2|nr:hypothetical protein [Microtetraspora sp. NBRC 13810]GLW08978.1 hypothetical protein Misp01_41080 [Microtetraspora sp. NBRC 13810]
MGSINSAPTTGRHIVSVLEQAWQDIRDRHPEIPDVVVITGRGSEGEWMTWGHWHWDPARWVADKSTKPELFPAGDLLGLGGRRVMEALLHDAVHGLATVRGIDDTMAYRYHNKHFLRLARELGLKGPKDRDPMSGYSACTITGKTAREYEATIAALDAAGMPYVWR